ncbi:MAG: glutathione S-transferase [Kangiella sp.]|nr:MAG: glutathione S-transferase [Kangiella sp.]
MITLHYLENSRAQRILWLLEELGVKYEVKHYYRDKVTMLAPKELKEIHPLGKSPVITDGDICIAESSAIVQYLIEKYGEGKLMPDKESDEYLKYRELMHYAEGTIMPFLVFTLIFNKIKEAPMPFFIKPIAKAIANKTLQSFVTPNVINNLDYLESLLAGKEWFVGNTMSGVDIMLSFPLEAAAARTNLKETHPNLKDFLENIHSLASYKKALECGLPYAFV